MWIVALVGEHDMSTAADVDVILLQGMDSGDPVVVDLRSATFIDSSILSAIISAANQAGRERLAVVLASGGEVSKLFDLVDGRSIVMTFATLQEAVERLYPTNRDAGQQAG